MGRTGRLLEIDDDLARAVWSAIGCEPAAEVEDVVDRFRRWLPMGSTAKWRAVDAGRNPPGPDPNECLVARLTGSFESWSCWPVCTALGALLTGAGHEVRVVAEQLREGRQVPVVDYHGVLVVNGSLVDAYLGPSAPVAAGSHVVRSDGWAGWIPGHRPSHVGGRGGSAFRYRQLADHLDRRDLEALCAISATHSGVGRRRTAHWLADDGHLCSVREDDDGLASLQVSRGGPFHATRDVIRRATFDELVRLIDGT